MRLLLSAGRPLVSLVFEDTWAADPSAGGGTSCQQITGTHGSLRPDGDAWVVTQGGKDETRYPIRPPHFSISRRLPICLTRDERRHLAPTTPVPTLKPVCACMTRPRSFRRS